MNNKGFTLIELLIVVLIVGVMIAFALPNYMRAIEKSRAVEAMNTVKNLNDGVYAYAAEHGTCPTFDKVLITIPGTKKSGYQMETKDFKYTLHAATSFLIPGTVCGGVVAERIDGSYKIWNPYKVINTETKKRTLACNASTENGIKVCKALGIYTTQTPGS